MIIKYDEHYSADYWTGRKQYIDANGRTQLYHGPALDWTGFDLVCGALTPLLPGKTLLDIGCGGGALAGRFLQKGYDAYGVDVSEYAIANCIPEMKGHLAVRDITIAPLLTAEWPATFDVVMATDLLEHLYFEDLDRTFDWMLKMANKWLFFLVAIQDDPKAEEFIHTKGDPIPPKFEGVAVSGHVHVRHPDWWIRYFKLKGLRIDWHRMYVFQSIRAKNASWQATGGWGFGNTFILEKR